MSNTTTIAQKSAVTVERTAKSSRQVTPKLTCIVTGKTRLTNAKYLASKPAGFVEQYISREALKMLRAGKSVDETRQLLNVTASVPNLSEAALKTAIAINGKHARQ